MKTFDFTKEIPNSDIMRDNPEAAMALMLTQALVADADSHKVLMAMISFDIGTLTLSGPDVAAYFYNNFTMFQIHTLFDMVVGQGPEVKIERFNNREEMEAFKADKESKETT